MSRLIAANQQVNLTYPEGLPDGLLVRGVAHSLARAAASNTRRNRDDGVAGK